MLGSWPRQEKETEAINAFRGVQIYVIIKKDSLTLAIYSSKKLCTPNLQDGSENPLKRKKV